MDFIFFHKALPGRLELLSAETGHMTDGLECSLAQARGHTGLKVKCILKPVEQICAFD